MLIYFITKEEEEPKKFVSKVKGPIAAQQIVLESDDKNTKKIKEAAEKERLEQLVWQEYENEMNGTLLPSIILTFILFLFFLILIFFRNSVHGFTQKHIIWNLTNTKTSFISTHSQGIFSF